MTIVVDWQKCFLNLRAAGVSSNAIKRRAHMDVRTIGRFQRGELKEPAFSQALEALDMHLLFCPEQHKAPISAGAR